MKIEDLYKIYKNHPFVNTDTRSIDNGQLFFALKGANFNGNEYAEQALSKGAAYAIIDEEKYKKNDRYLLVDDVLSTLQQLAHYHRKQLNIPFLAITGSNGKTTTKELINVVLLKKYKTLATKGNLNNHIGVPLTILSIDSSVEFAIIEMGANKPGDIKELCDIADPDYGIITNIGKAHLEGFGGIEGVKKTKGELYDHLEKKEGTIFINNANDVLVDRARKVINQITYLGKDAYYQASLNQSTGFLSLKTEENTSLTTHLVGDYNFENVVAALCIGKYFGISAFDAQNAIENYTPSNNRSQLMKLGSNTVIMDAYNANPSSMRAALENFTRDAAEHKTVILGDMFELGEDSKKEHETIIELANEASFQRVYFVGKNFASCKDSNYIFSTKEDLIKELQNFPINNSSILIKGSRGMKLEELTAYLSN